MRAERRSAIGILPLRRADPRGGRQVGASAARIAWPGSAGKPILPSNLLRFTNFGKGLRICASLR